MTHAADPDAMARPASITATKGATTYWSTGAYGYDGAGNVTAIGGSYFLYDPVSRLTTGTVSTSSLGTGSLKTQSYTYDAFGNIQSIAGTPGRSTPTSSVTNRLTGTAIYDASGNLTSWNGNAYEYDALNMMTRMTSGAEDWLYVYTADDERVWQYKLTSGSPFHRYTLRDLSGQVLREYTSAGDFWTVERDYVYRGGQLLAAQTPAGMRHFHLDHLGTPRLVTNENGQWVAYHVYYPFGEEATNAFQDEERMKFTGHERDLADPSGTGDDLDYMHARFCSPLTGRFLSADPLPPMRLAMKQAQAWNLYAYAKGNPIRFVDPTGLSIEFPGENPDDELQLTKDALIAAGANALADALQLQSIDGVIQVAPVDPGLIDPSNSTASLIGGFINDTKHTVSVEITSESIAGGVTKTDFANRSEILINPTEVSQILVYGKPLSGPLEGATVLAPISSTTTLVHEFGHAAANAKGFFAPAVDRESSVNYKTAIRYENAHRRMLKGPENVVRLGHRIYDPE